MSVPKQKRPKSSKRKKQYRLRLKPLILSRCPQCKKSVLSHHACHFCGTYNKKEIIKLKTKKEKKKEKKEKPQQEKKPKQKQEKTKK